MSCPSPPPPLPSPVLVLMPLPAPPPLTKNPSQKTLVHALSHDALRRVHPRHADNTRRSFPPRTLKRSLSHLPPRCRSPPPSPATRSPPPPVPPIPAFVRATNHSFIRPSIPKRVDRPHEGKRGESQPGGLGCMQFLAVHNPKGQCEA